MKIHFSKMKQNGKAKSNGGIRKTLNEIKLGISEMLEKSEKVDKTIAEQRELINQV